MSAVWGLNLPDSEKIVLLALADCADDNGLCWPSIATLCRKVSKSDRTVQAAIKGLVLKGQLVRVEVLGKGCSYTVTPRSGFAPEEPSPPKRATPTPEAASDKPSRTTIEEEEDAGAIDSPAAFFDAWNRMAAKSKAHRADRLTEKRRKAARARIEEYTDKIVAAAIAAVPSKPWLMGLNERGWCADIDWILRPDSIAKLREGKYDHGNRTRPANDQISNPRVAAAVKRAAQRTGGERSGVF
ncbi:helix-turn-helix domain-containing protein [Sphingomonas sp. SRS2]|uniref:helix-turn-helix domain-containing protein n=1 Tax=Sphingomonas sp. SRS2 TaxID=133190 RepID=UPI000A6CAB35|nr:helix-turn-helix domain-containing protein [Sphingomonas sp. SRS2]